MGDPEDAARIPEALPGRFRTRANRFIGRVDLTYFVWALALLAFSGLNGCYTVGFHPVEVPSTVRAQTQHRVGLMMKDEDRHASHRYRSFMSGIANRWTVHYGERVHEYAIAYLSAAFSEVIEANPGRLPAVDLSIFIEDIAYTVRGQAAHIALSVKTTDADGNVVLQKRYDRSGASGAGMVVMGGVFAQKHATRTSTNQALQEIFLELVEDVQSIVAPFGETSIRSPR